MSVLPLGDDELVAVLRCLPQAQLLGSCSPVSTQFRRAAFTAATDSINVRAGSLNSSFQQWMRQHGRAVRGFQVLPSSRAACTVLPADLLQQLPNLSSLIMGKAEVFFWLWPVLAAVTSYDGGLPCCL